MNAHLSDLRFGGGGGPAIQVEASMGSFTLDRFTVDSAGAGEGNFGGVVEFRFQGGQPFVATITRGRIEASGRNYAAPRGIIHVNGVGPAPHLLRVSDLDIDLGAPNMEPHYVVAGVRDTTGTHGYTGHVTISHVKGLGNLAPTTGYELDDLHINITSGPNVMHYQLGGGGS